jgi:hypothetical protein
MKEELLAKVAQYSADGKKLVEKLKLKIEKASITAEVSNNSLRTAQNN